MRAGVWKVAIVAAGLGFAVAVAGGLCGQDVAAARQATPSDRERAPEADQAATDIELIIHRVVPRTHKFQIDNGWISATRDEAAMLEGVRLDGQPLVGSHVGPRVNFTLVNMTDRGYLISHRTLGVMLRGRVDLTDKDGRSWAMSMRGFSSWGNEEAYTVPLAPGGRREMVINLGLTRMEPADDIAPLEKLDTSAEAVGALDELTYDIVQRCELLARTIDDGALGEPVSLRVRGAGVCEVGFDGPM